MELKEQKKGRKGTGNGISTSHTFGGFASTDTLGPDYLSHLIPKYFTLGNPS